jgi:hypothetical protein
MELATEAEAVVQNILDQMHSIHSHPDASHLVVISEFTEEKHWGWVIHYNSAEYQRTKHDMDAVSGNAPYLVNRSTGEVVLTGTAEPTEVYVQEYEEQLKRRT